MRLILSIAFLSILAACGNGDAEDQQASRLFSVMADYPLGVAVNRTDYESIDPDARRLYIAKMGGGQILVFDIDRNRLVRALDGFPKVTGVLAVPELGTVYASVPGSGLLPSLTVGLGMLGLTKGTGGVAVIGTRDLKERARVPGGVFPDGLAYDPRDRRIFVSDELGSALTVIDADSDKAIGRIDIGGETGNVRYDPATAQIYVPDQSHNELVAVDPKTLTVLSRRKLAGCDHPHGFNVAPQKAVGYVACDENDRLVTVDLATGRVLNAQPVARDPDVLAIDPVAARLYVASESGSLSTYSIVTPEAPHSLGDVYVAAGAHTVAVDPVSHRLYFALSDLNGRAVLRVLAPKSL